MEPESARNQHVSNDSIGMDTSPSPQSAPGIIGKGLDEQDERNNENSEVESAKKLGIDHLEEKPIARSTPSVQEGEATEGDAELIANVSDFPTPFSIVWEGC